MSFRPEKGLSINDFFNEVRRAVDGVDRRKKEPRDLAKLENLSRTSFRLSASRLFQNSQNIFSRSRLFLRCRLKVSDEEIQHRCIQIDENGGREEKKKEKKEQVSNSSSWLIRFFPLCLPKTKELRHSSRYGKNEGNTKSSVKK